MNVIRFVTLGVLAMASAFAAQPVINAGGIVNGASYLPGIAPGSIFVVKGSGLGPATLLEASSLPYQTSLSNTSITFTPAAGGAGIQALMVYTWDAQLAALLPSSAAPGNYNVTVTYNSATSAPVAATVVARNFGFVTQASSGAGPAQATYGGYDLNRFTTGSVAFAGHNWSLHPANDGNELILWGTGAGADSQSDINGGSSGDQTKDGGFIVNIGGVDVTPDYLGRSSGTPGLDQANFKIPANVTPGCFVNVQVRGNGFTSNLGTIAIASSGQKACSGSMWTESQLAKLDFGGTLTIGYLTLLKNSSESSLLGQTITSSTESANGMFAKYTIDTIATAPFSLTQIGNCYVFNLSGTAQQISQGGTVTPLNAGDHLTLNGPNASNVPMPMTSAGSDIYLALLYSSGFMGIGGSGSPTLTQGTYTIAGTGGTDVGAFSASVDFPGDLTWKNEDTIPNPIPRGSALTVNWTGGSTGLVAIAGTSYSTTAGGTAQNPVYNAGLFTCIAQATAGTFTVPVDVLGHLFAVSGDPSTGSYGSLSLFGVVDPAKSQFSVPSVDQAFFGYSIGATKTTGWN